MSPALEAPRLRQGLGRQLPGFVVLTAWMLRLLGLDRLALIGDEAYFFRWGQHLDWAYYDHPAGIGLLARLSTVLAGQSEFGIRWLNAGVGTLCVILIIWLGERLFSRAAGLLAGAAVAFGAPYIITSRFLYTDPLHLMALLLSLGAFWQFAHRGRRSDALFLGLSMCLAVNTKYTAYLFAIAMAVATLLDHRDLLKKRTTWWAFSLALIGLAPVLIWNARHDWASFAWQLAHLGMPSPGSGTGPLGWRIARNLAHATVYLTWPMMLSMIAGLLWMRGPAQRLLTLTALAMLAPVAVSPANSPRNLTTGGALLLLLAADRWVTYRAAVHSRKGRAAPAAVAGGVLGMIALFGAGSLAALNHSVMPDLRSSVVDAIRYDAAGWESVAEKLPASASIVAVDYSLAGQLAYYTRRPTTTAWPQYRLWDEVALDDAVVAASAYTPARPVTSALTTAYTRCAGPERVVMGAVGDSVKALTIWRVEGLRVAPETLLASLDFLTLYGTGE
jgi:4-amino-4-deoxy-L-arabinose transferase-like glycosyltransferase